MDLEDVFLCGLDRTRKGVTCFEANETVLVPAVRHLSNKLAYLSLPVIIIFTQNMNYCNLNFGGDFLVHQLKWFHCHDSLLGEYSNSTSVTGAVVIFS
jgi:hypothetical protein